MFDSLEALYMHIEREAHSFRYLIEIGDLFQKLRDHFASENSHDEVRVTQYEVDAFNLMVQDGRLEAQFVGSDNKGNEVKIPDIAKFAADEFAYFIERLGVSQNPILKARYAHILWEGPEKRQQYAVAAIDAYVELIPRLERLYGENKDGGLSRHSYLGTILECCQSALRLAVSGRQPIGKVESEVWRMINDTNSEHRSRVWFVHDLIALVLEYRKRFESEDLGSLAQTCLSIADQVQVDGDLHGAIRMNELGLRIDRTLQFVTADWNRRIAGCYEILMERREKSPIAATEWCQRAMDHYRAAGDQDKCAELALKREKFGGEIEFQEVSTTIDQTDHIAWCEATGMRLAELSTDELLVTIATDPNILPLNADMELHAREAAKVAPLRSMIAEAIVDNRMHVVEHAETPEEKLKHGILEAFHVDLKSEKVPLINAIIYCGFRAGRLDAKKVISSLARMSWFGITVAGQRGPDANYSYCWLDQLSPSIQAYFSYMKLLLEQAEPTELPIMAIDSLVLKFEGLVRDFAQLNGMLTHYDMKDNAGRTVTREKDLSVLLFDPRISGLFNPDDLLFFRFLFVEQSGFTLRHRVAHSLMLLEDYNFGILQLLFVALVRLAKYAVKQAPAAR
jgi:hypothetical protein